MQGQSKMAGKTDWVRFSLLLMTLLVLLIVALLNWHQNTTKAQQYAEHRRAGAQVFASLNTTVQQAFGHWQEQLTLISHHPDTLSLKTNAANAVEKWQQQMSALLPDAQQICFIKHIPETPVDTGCIALNFASLNVLRKLEQGKAADMVFINSDKPYLFMADAVKDKQGKYSGAVMLAIPSLTINKLLKEVNTVNGYVELTQGENGGLLVSSEGNAAFKQGENLFQQPLKGSFMRLSFWPRPINVAADWMLFSGIIVAVILVWISQLIWLKKLIRKDGKTLLEQIADLENIALKPSYPVQIDELHLVSDAIQGIALREQSSRLENRRNSGQAIYIQPLTVEDIEHPVETTPEPVNEQTETVPEEAPLAFTGEISDSVAADTSEPSDNTLSFTRDDIKEDVEKQQDNTLDFHLETVPEEQPLDLSEEMESDTIIPLMIDDVEVEIDESIFRAYDIRGICGSQLDAEVMYYIGKAVGSEALAQACQSLMVGRDGRLSSNELAEAFISGVLATGCDVVDLGTVTTPMLYFACEHGEFHSGAMITGSHNPKNYNGLKVLLSGRNLYGEAIKALFERIKTGQLQNGEGQRSQQDIATAYQNRVKDGVSLPRNLKLVVDCSNGIGGQFYPQLLEQLGCEVIPLYCDVDGHFPNHDPNPSQPENLKDLSKAVKQNMADLGLAFDGDGDRLGVVDAKGQIIWPDRIMMYLAQQLLDDEPGATIIYDVKCSDLLPEIIHNAGGRTLMSPAGHSVVKNMMVEQDAKLAGEFSGHIFFRDRWYGFDDALYSAVRLLESVTNDPLERSPTEIFATLPSRVSTPEIVIEMTAEQCDAIMQHLQQLMNVDDADVTTLDGLRLDFAKGWGLVRPSNTLSALTLRFEAEDAAELERIKKLMLEPILKVNSDLSTLIFKIIYES